MMEVEEADAEKHPSPEEFIGIADFPAGGSDQLSFATGDRLLVHDKSSPDWWWAELQGNFGYVPSNHLQRCTQEEEVDEAWQDEEYFGNYGTLRLHLEMLADRARTETYRQVILSNSAPLRGKVVMDLGCGTGIISLFCARLAQPAAVYAVEASSMAEQAQQLVQQNGCEGVVSVLRGRAEELQLPGKVDVLVSEWMGNCLLFEFMVESVLVARDRWLKQGGVMWPSSASLTLVPCQAPEDYSQKVDFWTDPYGLDFSCLRPLALTEFFSKPKFSHQIRPEDCLSSPCDVLTLDMHTVQVPDLERLKGEFNFRVEKAGPLHGFTAWFSVQFQGLQKGGAVVELDTGPHAPPTHWKQTLFMLDTPVSLRPGDTVCGTLLLHRNPVWRRHMTITLQWSVSSPGGTAPSETQRKSFPMWR
ncbi:protein arginine N-methyltransferase 2 [Megalops cyprinoides]|uniref:protein arginine N-methyltransferase 2 n=1 Tax=Megalops cyprinoides TaxID=118141 RepID=UPI0018643298|nr:protein arginine N-methyltransferase 2 [Megalops cyprinoides]